MKNENQKSTETKSKSLGQKPSRVGSRKPKGNQKPSTRTDEKFDVILQSKTLHDDKGAFIGYEFYRAVKVKLPNGAVKLLTMEDEKIILNFSESWEILPSVIRLLENENKVCPEFGTQTKSTKQHSVESKVLRYIKSKSASSESLHFLLISELKSSNIDIPHKKDVAVKGTKPITDTI